MAKICFYCGSDLGTKSKCPCQGDNSQQTETNKKQNFKQPKAKIFVGKFCNRFNLITGCRRVLHILKLLVTRPADSPSLARSVHSFTPFFLIGWHVLLSFSFFYAFITGTGIGYYLQYSPFDFNSVNEALPTSLNVAKICLFYDLMKIIFNYFHLRINKYQGITWQFALRLTVPGTLYNILFIFISAIGLYRSGLLSLGILIIGYGLSISIDVLTFEQELYMERNKAMLLSLAVEISIIFAITILVTLVFSRFASFYGDGLDLITNILSHSSL